MIDQIFPPPFPPSLHHIFRAHNLLCSTLTHNHSDTHASRRPHNPPTHPPVKQSTPEHRCPGHQAHLTHPLPRPWGSVRCKSSRIDVNTCAPETRHTQLGFRKVSGAWAHSSRWSRGWSGVRPGHSPPPRINDESRRLRFSAILLVRVRLMLRPPFFPGLFPR